MAAGALDCLGSEINVHTNMPAMSRVRRDRVVSTWWDLFIKPGTLPFQTTSYVKNLKKRDNGRSCKLLWGALS